MKKLFFLFSLLWCFFVQAQESILLHTFKLDNGLTVYLLPDKNATKTFGAVAVNAGSKNDPADATGLAHYLEHLLFKGTARMGTMDYEKEKPFLDSITIYYKQLALTSDTAQRSKIKSLINQQSIQASKYGLPTEFHSLLSSIGGSDINAFTQTDMTVYHNSFPAEQMEKWLDLYVERFTNPVFRSFQSELEVVYEEKNRGSDNYGMQLIELLNQKLYPNHPYGTQTTIGSTEHLKNPPINRIYEFFNTYYVANNMALILSGNFELESTLSLIKEKMKTLRSGSIPEFKTVAPFKFSQNEEIDIRITPIKMDFIGFKSVPNTHEDETALEVCSYMLFNNSETGFLNKLQLNGKILAAGLFPYHLHDDGAEIVYVVPKIIGQSFKEAEKLVFTEIQKLIDGNFPDELFAQVKAEMIKDYKLSMEDPESRGLKLLDVFNCSKDWSCVTSYPDRVNKLTKEDIVRVAMKYYGAPHIAIHSKTGFPKKDKLAKPGFKPIPTDQTAKSEFAKIFEERTLEVKMPRFINFNEDVSTKDLGNGNTLYCVANPYNDIASLKIKFKVGEKKINHLDLAAVLLTECYPKGSSLDSYNAQLAALNFTTSIECDDDFFSIQLTGEEKNLGKALELVNALLKQAVASSSAIKNLQDGIKANYKIEKEEPATMGRILLYYALYGKDSEYKDRISVAESKELKAESLLELIGEATNYAADIHFCGNSTTEEVSNLVNTKLSLGKKYEDFKLHYLPSVAIEKNTIFIVNDPKARQNQVFFSALGETYHTMDDAKLNLLNQYMGGSFSGLILQEIREYRSLAYNAGGRFKKPVYDGKPLEFVSYLGCQADKTNEAIEVMMNLIRNLPQYENRLPVFKSYVGSTIGLNYPTPREVSERVEILSLKGFKDDPNKITYSQLSSISFKDMYTFYQKNLQNKNIVITIYGDISKVDLEKLKHYSTEIIELKPSDIATF